MPKMFQREPQPENHPGRHASLDTLRGGLLVLMALNHIPSILSSLTQQPLGFVTAAEGFVFLAGLVIGLVSTRRWDKHGARAGTRALLNRGWVIYRAHLACVLAIVAWMLLYFRFSGAGHPPVGTPWIWMFQPWSSGIATLLLLHQPGLLDVLPTYCGLLLVSPLVMWGFTRGRLSWVLAVSLAWWAATNLFDPPRPTVWRMINTGAFNFGAWQFLYVAGMACGFGWARGSLPRWNPSRWTVFALLAAVAFLSACSHQWITLGLSHETWFTISNKNNLAPVRMLNFGILALLAHLWLRKRRDDLGWPVLALMGRNSLAVFSVHCVTGLVILGLPAWFDFPPHRPMLGLMDWIRCLGHAPFLGMREWWDLLTYGPVLGPVLMMSIMVLTAWIAERMSKPPRGKVPSFGRTGIAGLFAKWLRPGVRSGG